MSGVRWGWLAVAVACGEAKEPPSVAPVAGSVCGDGILDAGEWCDDGNAAYDDGCTPDCVPTEGSEGVDDVLQAFMAQWQLPALSFAVARDGRLAVLRAYGEADPAAGRPAHGDDRYRIASVSKPITAAVMLRLVEEGRLGLDDRVVDHLDASRLPPGGDDRLVDVTVRDLLQHSGGWDRDATGDPMFNSAAISADLGIAGPASAWDVIAHTWARPLTFAPGARFAYANLGYAVAGRVIEGAWGGAYVDAAHALVLDPAGASGMHLGRTRPSDRGDDEVAYVDHAGAGLAASVFPGDGDVPWPDGGFHLEAMDAHGGWVASAPELIRFVAAVDGFDNRADVLSGASLAAMAARPELPTWERADAWYGLGWSVRRTAAGENWWHAGSLPGTSAIVVRRDDGVVWAALTNTRPADAAAFSEAFDAVMWEAVGEIKVWPPFDLFDAPGR